MARIPTNYISRPKPTVKKENWVVLSNDNLSLMPLLDVDVKLLKDKANKNGGELIIGDIYSLGKESVEGVEFGNIYFRLYGVVKDYKGVNLDSLVVKEIGLDSDGNVIEGANQYGRRKFSISPSMCKMMGLKYSPGLELWPINSGFKKVNIDSEIYTADNVVYENMSTYPVSEKDGTIRKIILEIHGFSPFDNSHIITPTGAMIPTEDFVSSLTVFAKQNISTDNGCAGFRIGDKFSFKIVVREEKDGKTASMCDENHNIYLMVDLTKVSHNVNTVDGVIGVAHTALEGKDIDDIIGVKWDEANDENKPKPKDELNAAFDMTMENVDKVFEALEKEFGWRGKIMTNLF